MGFEKSADPAFCPIWLLFSRVRPAQGVKKGKKCLFTKKIGESE